MAIVPEISWRNPEIGPELPRIQPLGRPLRDAAARRPACRRHRRRLSDRRSLGPLLRQRADSRTGDISRCRGPTISRSCDCSLAKSAAILRCCIPEVLDQRCRVDGTELLLENTRELGTIQGLAPARLQHHPPQQSEARSNSFTTPAARWSPRPACRSNPRSSARTTRCAELTQEMFGPTGRGVFVPKPDERSLRSRPWTAWAWSGTSASTMCLRYPPRLPRWQDPYVNQSATNPEWYEGGQSAVHLHPQGARPAPISTCSPTPARNRSPPTSRFVAA